MSTIDRLTYQDIKVKSPFNIKSLYDLKITIRPNQHSTMYLSGLLDPEDDPEKTVIAIKEKDTVEVYYTQENKKTTLYCGMINTAQLKIQNNMYYIQVEGISHTFKYDVKLKNRSYQQPGSTYEEILKDIVYKEYDGDFLLYPKDKEINKILLQYQETDWQFFKRIASHFGMPLVPDITAHMPRFYIGMRRGRPKTIDLQEQFNYTKQKDIKECMTLVKNNVPNLHQADFITYTIKSAQIFDMGDVLTCRDQTLFVTEITREMQKGQLSNTYKLSNKKDLTQKRIENQKIRGVSLEGTVLQAAGNTINIHLEIDKKMNRQQTTATTYPFHYASQANNILYLMPEIGHYVSLYFPDEEESNACAVNSVRKNGGTCAKTGDNNIKYWGIPNGKEIKLGYTDLAITSKAEQLYITLDEEKGIEVKSDHDLNISSGSNINIISQKAVEMKAGYDIVFTHTESGSMLKIDAADASTTVAAADYITYTGEEGTPTYESLNAQLEMKPAKERNLGTLVLKCLAAVAIVAVATVVTAATFGVGAGLVAGAIVSCSAAYGAYKALSGRQPGDSIGDTIYDFFDYMSFGAIITGTALALASTLKYDSVIGALALSNSTLGIFDSWAYYFDSINLIRQKYKIETVGHNANEIDLQSNANILDPQYSYNDQLNDPTLAAMLINRNNLENYFSNNIPAVNHIEALIGRPIFYGEALTDEERQQKFDKGIEVFVEGLIFRGAIKGGKPGEIIKINPNEMMGKKIIPDSTGSTLVNDGAGSLTGKRISGAGNALDDGLGTYANQGGHHPMAKGAFEGAKGYDANSALTISKSKLSEFGVDHNTITGQQHSLYSAFSKTGQPLTMEAMKQIEIKAMTNSGVPLDYATNAVERAISELLKSGVTQPIKIPWVK